MELRECNAAFNKGYISGKQGPERGGSCLQGCKIALRATNGRPYSLVI